MEGFLFTGFVVEFEGEYTCHDYSAFYNDIDSMFTMISQIICFSDCTDEEVVEIMWKGVPVHYVGWRPDMYFRFEDKIGNLVWDGYFPRWDH